MKNSFTRFKYFSNNTHVPFELSQIAPLNIAQDPEKWTVVDVPGDGNCWIYATLISGYYITGTRIRMNPQECRDQISDLLMRVSRLPSEHITMFLKEMHLVSTKGVKLKSLSDALHFRNLPEMLSALLRVGTPGSCLWQGDLGEELDLLATILRQSIISFSSDALRSNTACRILDSDIGPLKFFVLLRSISECAYK